MNNKNLKESYKKNLKERLKEQLKEPSSWMMLFFNGYYNN